MAKIGISPEADIKRVVITGPESTGKTTVASQLAIHFGTVWVPEFAREYVSELGRRYTYEDVENIALKQIKLEKEYSARARNFLFVDTDLIITKIWFYEVFNKCPEWVQNAISETPANLYLVCNTDIPWIPDPVRENGGEMREKLLSMYISEIEATGSSWELVSGTGRERTKSAVNAINKTFGL